MSIGMVWSARRAIVLGCLLLVALPLLLLSLAYGYERWIVNQYQQRLHALAREVLDGKLGSPASAQRAGVEIRWLDGWGRVEADSQTGNQAIHSSFFGGLAERVLEIIAPGVHPERFADIDRSLGPIAGRAEVEQALRGQTVFAEHRSRSGQTLIFTLAVPRPTGGAVYITKASRRGIRRLLELRGELVKLAAYQVPFAFLFTLLLGRWLVRPLERLALAARRYPSQALADRRLLGRRDEIGELARAMTVLAAELDRRRRVTADLGADVAHEFKNPLATIAASAELIASTQHATTDKRAMVAEHIIAAVERLKQSIDALLALLRLEVELPDAPRERVAYAELVRTVVDEYRRDPRYQSFDFRVEAAPDVNQARLVAARWTELLRNLIDNAVIQPATRNEIVIRLYQSDGSIVTAVQDHGPGISPGNRDQIFRRFFSQRPAGTPPGTGLGLSIVTAVAEAHGGRVEVESTPGAGATFRVFLPT